MCYARLLIKKGHFLPQSCKTNERKENTGTAASDRLLRVSDLLINPIEVSIPVPAQAPNSTIEQPLLDEVQLESYEYH